MQKEITQSELKKVLHYNPKTGVFRWRKHHKSHKTHLGKIAGTTAKTSKWGKYRKIRIDKKQYYAHRLAFLYMKGYIPENLVDHKDRNSLNNKWENLREVSPQCSSRNCSLYKRNKSGVSGVGWKNNWNKWTVSISINGKKKYIGAFRCFDEAVAHRLAAEQCLGWKGCNSTSSAYLYVKGERDI